MITKGLTDEEIFKEVGLNSDNWIIDRTFEDSCGSFLVHKNMYKLSKSIQEKNRKFLKEQNKNI